MGVLLIDLLYKRTMAFHSQIIPLSENTRPHMAKTVRSLFFFALLLLITFSSSTALAQQEEACSTHQFPNHKSFAACNDLPVLNATIYWSYFPSNGTVDVAYRASLVSEARWVAWAINPTSDRMVGSQAFIAFRRTDGSMAAYSSPIGGYMTGLQPGSLSFPVHNLSAVYQNKEITIFVTIGLPTNATTARHVWQEGPLVDDAPRMHALAGPNMRSYGTLDFVSGKVEATGTQQSPFSKLKISHGFTNAISWGFLLPTGAIVARNFKGHAPWWFYVHISNQMLGAAGGVAGFVTGKMIGNNMQQGHRCIGISLMTILALQVGVGFLFRPKPEHKYRKYWNGFHYLLGYGGIALGIANCFKGLEIMAPPKLYIRAFIGIVSFMASITLGMAAYTWYKTKTEHATIEKEQSADTIV